MPEKPCVYCGRWFEPDPRTEFPKACPRENCRKARKREADREWRRKNPGRADAGRLGKVRRWAKGYPGYWRQYRAGHPEYRARERERMRGRRVRVAKQDEIRQNPVGYLTSIRGPGNVAKQDEIGRQVDGIVEYLEAWARVAKPNDMAPGSTGGG